MSTAVCIVSDGLWLSQAESLCRQIRRLRRSERVCLLLLDSPSKAQHATLTALGVEVCELTEYSLPVGIPRTGLKMWLPRFFESKGYLLLDSDLILLSEDFFNLFSPVPGRVKLVQESALCWRAGKKGISSEYHAAIVGRSILQTGVMSFDRTFWRTHFEEVLRYIVDDPSEFGDMAALNLFVAHNPQLLEPVPEEACLVLRPSALGPSTEAHLQRTAAFGKEILYDGRRVLSVHYTNSRGEVCNYERILGMVQQNGRRL